MRIVAAVLCIYAVVMTAESRAEEGEAARSARPLTAASNAILHDLDALFLLQDATARGRLDAASLQKALLVSIADKILENSTNQPEGLAPYVAGYILSGGDPQAATALVKSDKLTPDDRRLLEGVSDFMAGNREKATEHLENIDIESLPARIAGRVMLAKALLEAEPDARQTGLAMAMAYMPGTLVEESALRRSALAYAEAGKAERFWKRLERYQRRYPDSLYARTFWEDVMAQVIDMSRKSTSPDLERLAAIMGSMRPDARRDLYLHLARRAAVVSQIAVVEFAAGSVKQLAATGSAESHVARFYLSLYAVTSERGEAAIADLQALDRSVLLPRERALLDAAIWTAQQITRPLQVSKSVPGRENGQKSPLQIQAEELLADVDKVLAESNS